MPRAKLKLNAPERREFLDLVGKLSSRDGGERVIARIRMRKFIETHGKDACDEFYRHHFKQDPP